jgi:hypothetical protein
MRLVFFFKNFKIELCSYIYNIKNIIINDAATQIG